MNDCDEILNCLACGAKHKNDSILDLGIQPLANSYKKQADDEELKFPLAINVCSSCYHVQLTHRVNPDLLFKHYLYVSGTSKTQLDYFKWFAQTTLERCNRDNVKVLDIGCNDGSQLDSYKEINPNIIRLGIDPAENIYETSSKKHDVTLGYFNQISSSYKEKNFDIILCQNAFAHNYDPLQFLKDCKEIMNDHAELFITTSQANMILNGEFDTIYHEHISFYNIKSMSILAKRAGLNLIEVMKHPIHGTSYIFIFSKTKNDDKHIERLIEEETELGLFRMNTYVNYSNKCKQIIKQLKQLSDFLADNQFEVIGYGAAAKGTTLINSSKINLKFVVDDNPLKQEMYIPGTTIKIVSKNELSKLSGKIVCIPLAWNFFEEIKSNLKDSEIKYFIKYFPTFEILPNE